MYRIFSVLFFCMITLFANSQTSATEYYNTGKKLKDEKKVKEALEAFEKAIQLKPDYAEAIYETGWCRNDLKDYSGAIFMLRKARNLIPRVPKVYFELGYAFDKSGQTDSAIVNYNKCLSLKHDYCNAHKQLAYVYYTKDEYNEALAYFASADKKCSIAITDYLFWYRRGFSYNAIKKYDSAIIFLSKSLQYKTDYENTYLELGFANTKLKKDAEAIEQFTKAMNINPKSHIPYNGIAEVYRDNKKDMNEAMNWYKKTMAINPKERKANFGMGYCLNSQSKYSEAIPYLKQAIESENTYTAAYVELGYSYFKTGDNTLALTHLNKALELNPKNENARFYKGLLYISKGDKTNAMQMYNELNSMGNKNAAALKKKIDSM